MTDPKNKQSGIVGELRELLEKATPGPWRHRNMLVGQREYPEVWAGDAFVAALGENNHDNAHLIAALRNAAPDLLRVVEAVAEWRGDPCLCGGHFPQHESACVWLLARGLAGSAR